MVKYFPKKVHTMVDLFCGGATVGINIKAEKTFLIDKNERDEAMTLYKISKDMSHASGYNFNASEGVVDVSCHNVLIHSYKMTMHFLLNATETLCEHGIEVSMKEIFDMFKLLLEMQYTGMQETIKGFTN